MESDQVVRPEENVQFVGREVVGRRVGSHAVNDKEEITSVIIEFWGLRFMPAILDRKRVKVEDPRENLCFRRGWTLKVKPKEFAILRHGDMADVVDFLENAQ
jgi:hypothetical protein